MSDRSGLSRLLGMVATAVVLVLSPPVRADGPDLGFHIGVAPHASARVILELYQPLREALQAGLGLPVEVVTAPDFTTYARRALAQDYDIAIVAGQQARMLETDGGYRPLVAYKAEFRTVAVVAAASAIQGPLDLAGTAIAGLGSASLADIWGLEWLRSAGIEVPEVTQVSAADSMARLILSGRASVGFMSLASFQFLAPDIRAQLRILATSGPMLGRVYMLNARYEWRRDKVMESLRAFSESPSGKRHFDQVHLEGYRDVGPDELKAMEPYAQKVRETLKKAANK